MPDGHDSETSSHASSRTDMRNPKILAAVAKWIFSLQADEVEAYATRLELILEGSIFEQMSRLSQNLLYDYNAEDFLPNTAIAEDQLEEHRKKLIKALYEERAKAAVADEKHRRRNITPATLSAQTQNNDTFNNETTPSRDNICLYTRATLDDGTVLNLPTAVVDYSRQLNPIVQQTAATSTVPTNTHGFRQTQATNSTILPAFGSQQRSRGGGNSSPMHPSAANNYNTATFRTKDVGEIVRKWGIKFSGDNQTSIEEFLCEIERRAHLSQLSEDELLMAIPEALKGIAMLWYKSMSKYWYQWGDFCQAARKHFGAGQDFQQSLEAEIASRTQGPDESAHSYIFSQLALAEKLNPPMDMNKKLRILYKNLKPEMKSYIWKTNFLNEEDFITHALDAEKIILSNAHYKPPPAPEMSLIPEMAYRPKKQANTKQNINTNVNSLAVEVAAILQESSIGWRQLKTGKDARGKASASSSDSDSDFDRRNYSNKKQSRYFRRNQNYQNNQQQPKDQASSKPNSSTPAAKPENQQPNNDNKQQNKAPKDRQRGGQSSAPPGPCPNCKKSGHWRRDCPEKPQELKCWTCNEPGVTKRNCPKCNLNEKREA